MLTTVIVQEGGLVVSGAHRHLCLLGLFVCDATDRGLLHVQRVNPK
jgi:hypothetical protein